MKLLSPGSTNTKLAKGAALHTRYLNFILHLAPADVSGRNVCPNASPGCIAVCLNTAGRGVFSNVQQARIRKTRLFTDNRDAFMSLLFKDLKSVVSAARRRDLTPVVRLNGTSDIPWEHVKLFGTGLTVFDTFTEIQFYDYTKSLKRSMRSVQDKTWPANYHLTFSRSECNDSKVSDALRAGVSVAVVFKGEAPRLHQGTKTIDGDTHDFRFLDQRGVVVALTAKGKAKRDTSGFVI